MEKVRGYLVIRYNFVIMWKLIDGFKISFIYYIFLNFSVMGLYSIEGF